MGLKNKASRQTGLVVTCDEAHLQEENLDPRYLRRVGSKQVESGVRMKADR